MFNYLISVTTCSLLLLGYSSSSLVLLPTYLSYGLNLGVFFLVLASWFVVTSFWLSIVQSNISSVWEILPPFILDCVVIRNPVTDSNCPITGYICPISSSLTLLFESSFVLSLGKSAGLVTIFSSFTLLFESSVVSSLGKSAGLVMTIISWSSCFVPSYPFSFTTCYELIVDCSRGPVTWDTFEIEEIASELGEVYSFNEPWRDGF